MCGVDLPARTCDAKAFEIPVAAMMSASFTLAHVSRLLASPRLKSFWTGDRSRHSNLPWQ